MCPSGSAGVYMFRELTHNWGTESDPEFKGYHNGNSDPRGAYRGLLICTTPWLSLARCPVRQIQNFKRHVSQACMQPCRPAGLNSLGRCRCPTAKLVACCPRVCAAPPAQALGTLASACPTSRPPASALRSEWKGEGAGGSSRWEGGLGL